MYTALVSAGTSTQAGFSVTSLLVVIALFVIGWPLFRRLRGSLSENRKKRWVEEGLMDPPSAAAEPAESRSDMNDGPRRA